VTQVSEKTAKKTGTLTQAAPTEVRRKYAHFQRLMTSLMWECLTGEHGDGVPGVAVHWLERDENGKPLRHELHLPTGELLETGLPQYNSYRKAIYVLADERKVIAIKKRLEELGRVSKEARLAAGVSRISRHLLFPDLREGVKMVRFKRIETFSSHKRTKEYMLDRLERYLADYQRVTAEKYERGAKTEDAVLKARYEEIAATKLKIKLLESLNESHFRERQRLNTIRPYLLYDNGASEQLHLKDVGLIVVGNNVQIVDIERGNFERRKGGKRSRLEPLFSFEGGITQVYSEAAWQMQK
jgi:hypothetical protein